MVAARRRFLWAACILGSVAALIALLVPRVANGDDVVVTIVQSAMEEYRTERGEWPASYFEVRSYLERHFGAARVRLTERAPGEYDVDVRRGWFWKRIQVLYRVGAHGEVETYDVQLAR